MVRIHTQNELTQLMDNVEFIEHILIDIDIYQTSNLSTDIICGLLQNFTNLKDLTFCDNYRIPIDVSKLSNLTCLVLGRNFNYPLNISNLTNLIRLQFPDIYTHKINLSKLSNLQVLCVGNTSYYDFSKLPTNFSK